MLTFDGAGDFRARQYGGRNLHFGIREHGMAAAVNGMSLSFLRAYGATFFVFSDYLRPAMRLSAIMRLPSIFIFTHDSIGVGEDGPTHQPIEHLAACRAIPGLIVLRPGDANEVAEAWRVIMPLKDRPVAWCYPGKTCRRSIARSTLRPRDVAHGAYILADAAGGKPDVILIGTGSELSFAVEAYEQLTKEGVKARVGEHADRGSCSPNRTRPIATGAAAERDGAGGGRSGRGVRLGAVSWAYAASSWA